MLWVWGVSFSPNGDLIASAHNDGKVKLWRRDGRLVKNWTGHNRAVSAVAFSPNGKIIATASADRTVKLWKLNAVGEIETSPYKTLSGYTNAVSAVAFNPNSQIIATASNDNTVKLWKTDGTFIKTLTGHRDEVSAVAFSPDGKTLASGSKDETVILWDLQKNLDIKQLLVLGCDWVGDYLKTNPNVSDNDKHLCDGIGNKK